MTEDERDRAVVAALDALDALDAQRDKLTAWLARPLHEQQADQDKIEHALATGGVTAGRRVMAAPGLPTLPDELCEPPKVLEAWAARDAAEVEELGLEEDEPVPMARFDH